MNGAPSSLQRSTIQSESAHSQLRCLSLKIGTLRPHAASTAQACSRKDLRGWMRASVSSHGQSPCSATMITPSTASCGARSSLPRAGSPPLGSSG